MNKIVMGLIVILVVVGVALILLQMSNSSSVDYLNSKPTSTVVGQNPIFTTQSAVSSTASSTSPQTNVWGEYHVSLPDSIMLVDSQGRRTGKDPVTGMRYHEIPGTSYSEVGSPSTGGAGELLTSDLPNGRYTLYVLGGRNGSYWLDASHYGQQDQNFSGTIQVGSMVAYTQDYNAANLASSTFSFKETVSSTTGITSAPPRDLPPPPVP